MSFTDMMSSGRGPGVIGMLLAMVVLAGFGILFVFVFDENLQGGGQTLEGQIRQQSTRLTGLQDGITHSKREIASAEALRAKVARFEAMKQQADDSTRLVETLNSDIVRRTEEIATLESEFALTRANVRSHIRELARDEEVAELRTRDGEVFTNITLREVSAVGIQIRHADGMKRIGFEQLPDSWIERFQFDAEERDAELNQEKQSHRQLEEAVAAADAKRAAMREAAAADREADVKLQALASKRTQVARLKGEIQTLRTDLTKAANDASRARDMGRSHVNRTKNVQARIDAKLAELTTVERELARLQSNR